MTIEEINYRVRLSVRIVLDERVYTTSNAPAGLVRDAAKAQVVRILGEHMPGAQVIVDRIEVTPTE
jgi:hypothetical protein